MPPGIENDNYDSEGDIHFLEELLRNDSLPLPENESFNFDHHDDPSFLRPPPVPPDVEFFFDFEPDTGVLTAKVVEDIYVESLSPSHIPVEYSDSLMDEIDLFLATDDLMPPGIESDDYDSKGDIHFLEELLVNDSISLPKNKSSNFDHHDDPSFLHPPPEPSNVEFYFDFEPNSGELIAAVMNNIDELNEDECFEQGGEIDVFTNVEDDGVKTPFLTLASLFRASGISSGWNFHML
nr:hypothetical protein [Tanacetum cinerariifolium]